MFLGGVTDRRYALNVDAPAQGSVPQPKKKLLQPPFPSADESRLGLSLAPSANRFGRAYKCNTLHSCGDHRPIAHTSQTRVGAMHLSLPLLFAQRPSNS